MTGDWQEIAALVVVALVAVASLRRWWIRRSKKDPGACGQCGPTDKDREEKPLVFHRRKP